MLEKPESIPTFLSSILPDVDDADIAKAKAELESQGIKLPE